MVKLTLYEEHINELSLVVAREIIKVLKNAQSLNVLSTLKLCGIPRGGVPAVYAVSKALTQLGSLVTEIKVTSDPEEAHIFVDDIIDSGETRDAWRQKFPHVLFYALIDKSNTDAYDHAWVSFPWERSLDGADNSADDIPTRLLEYIGEDPTRGGLKETPKRFLKAWDFWSSGYAEDPAAILKVFEDGAENYDEMVIVKDIPVYSHCEHHLAPFFGVAHIGYIPEGRIVGLSKLSRLVDVFSRRLQVQERLTNEIAKALSDGLKPQGVAVVLECRHLCMESRGIQRQGSSTITSSMKGVLMESPSARAEFLSLIKRGKICI